ncbi:MAG: penicillin-binding protein 2 [Elusimicrobia bacterium]|nr:penicillin-binding protein 2 [Elusimicrobiota bacterium]
MINKKGAILPFILFALGFSFLAVRLFFIQVWEHEILKKKVDQISVRERSESSLRGSIFDRFGRVLTVSSKVYTYFADPKICKGLKEISAGLKKLNINFNNRSVKWNKDSSYVPLLKNIDGETMQRIKSLEIKGTGFTTEYIRKYTEDRMACHLIGVVGVSGLGLSGIEFSKNKELIGDKYNIYNFRDGLGREIPETFVKSKELKGFDVYLTIDKNLQFIAEKEIENAYNSLHPQKAMVIIQDPNSGEILAMASRPNFNQYDFSKNKESLKNYAVSDIFEPGSTFKIVTITAALEENIAKPTDTIYCEDGQYVLYDHSIKDHEKKGSLTVNEIMEYSSNIGTAKLGQKLGKEKLFQYIRQFGFNNKTGVDLPGETKGMLNPPEKWSGLSVAALSFGQEIGVTALQMINAYSAVANGGILLEPKVVKSVKGPSVMKEDFEVRTIRRVARPEVIREIQRMLVNVVEKGTGQNAKIYGYRVGGKTGTAQKKDSKTNQYSSTAFVSSFCGIVPMSSPKLTILVVLDEPKGDYWGSSTAAPIFRKIASQAVRYLKIAPDAEITQSNNKKLNS